jgi:hypothetical protein
MQLREVFGAVEEDKLLQDDLMGIHRMVVTHQNFQLLLPDQHLFSVNYLWIVFQRLAWQYYRIDSLLDVSF